MIKVGSNLVRMNIIFPNNILKHSIDIKMEQVVLRNKA